MIIGGGMAFTFKKVLGGIQVRLARLTPGYLPQNCHHGLFKFYCEWQVE